MIAWLLSGKSLLNEEALGVLNSSCPCEIFFEIDAVRDCGCYTGGIDIGTLSGRYKVTYISGAVRTRMDYKWNLAGYGYCYGRCLQPCFCAFLGGNLCPGFAEGGFDTAAEAEAYAKGKYLFMDFNGDRHVTLGFSDDLCTDSTGSIVYSIVKVSSLTESQRIINRLPEALQ